MIRFVLVGPLACAESRDRSVLSFEAARRLLAFDLGTGRESVPATGVAGMGCKRALNERGFVPLNQRAVSIDRAEPSILNPKDCATTLKVSFGIYGSAQGHQWLLRSYGQSFW